VVQAAGGVDDHDVTPLRLGLLDAPGGRLDRVGRAPLVDGHLQRLAERLQLLDGGGPVDVAGDQRGRALLLGQQASQLSAGGGLAGALQAGHQDHGGRAVRERELGAGLAHKAGQLLVHDLDDLLAGGEAVHHLRARGPLAYAVDEVLDDAEVDVGLE
jgi:hypothetical protein